MFIKLNDDGISDDQIQELKLIASIFGYIVDNMIKYNKHAVEISLGNTRVILIKFRRDIIVDHSFEFYEKH